MMALLADPYLTPREFECFIIIRTKQEVPHLEVKTHPVEARLLKQQEQRCSQTRVLLSVKATADFEMASLNSRYFATSCRPCLDK